MSVDPRADASADARADAHAVARAVAKPGVGTEPSHGIPDGLEARVRRLEDLHAIGQLRAHYCQALDDGRWDDLVDLFTPDGAFVGLSTARGHDELRTFFAELQEGPLSAWWHFSSNETIDLIGSPAQAATGTTWLDQPCVVDGRAHIAAGRYEDELVRGDDGRWRFAQRKVSFFFWVPGDQDWTPGAYGWGPARAAADARTLARLDHH